MSPTVWTRPAAVLALFAFPLLALADFVLAEQPSPVESIFTFLYYLSAFGFLVAAIIMGFAVSGFGRSAIGSALSYLVMGTGVFFVIAVFQTLGPVFFGIGDESMDIWWHILFYAAFALFFVGLRSLVTVSDSFKNLDGQAKEGAEGVWSAVVIIFLIGVFTLPRFVDGIILAYAESPIAAFGLHHFLAFAAAGLVGAYLIFAKQRFGTIGNAIATPMAIAVGLLAVQHFWELLTESWKIIATSSETIEGVEKIFLVGAAICMVVAAWNLKTFSLPGAKKV